MPQFLLSEATVGVLAQVVVHFLWQGALLGILAACLLHVSPIRTAHARYAFYCGLLMLLAICPLVTWRGIYAGPVAIIEIQGESATKAGDGAALAKTEESTDESIAMQLNAVQSSNAQSIIRPHESRLIVAGPWLARQYKLIVTAWLAGICFMATRLLLGAIGVRTLARRRRPIPPEVAHVVERLSRQLAFHVRPAVHAVERISQAMAVGIFKPMVLLPASWISELPSDVLEAVIAHELSHLRRWDMPINLMQRVVETLLFFHPVVWWCSRRLRVEREMCCDELAQATIGNREVYAKALAYLAHQQCSSVESLLAAGIGGTKMVLLERICNVLGMVPGRHGRLYGPSCALVGAVVTSLAWMAALALSAPWQSRTSIPDDQEAIVARSEPSTPPEAAESGLATDAIEPSTPLDEVAQALEPLTLENLKFESHWDLSLEETVQNAMFNSKVVRSLGGRFTSSARDPGMQTGETRQLPTLVCTSDVSRVDLEMAVLSLRNDTEQAYWELWFAWRNLETANTALNSARQTWQKIYTLYRAGSKGGEANAEAQAREQFYQFKSQAHTLLNELTRAENRLRYVMGVAATDGRLIRPIDKPTVDRVSFDWEEITKEALARSPGLSRQRWRIKQRELELIAAKNLLQPHLDLNGSYRWLGLADNAQGQEAGPSKVDDPLSPDGSREAETFDSAQFQEWQLGLQSTATIGLRKKLAQLRHFQLQLARERAKLQDKELEVSHQLTDAVRQLVYNYELTQTNFNRALAADRQMEAMQAAFEAETVTIDQLLEAQRRRAEAHASYFHTLLDYQRSIVTVRHRKGSLL